MYRKAFVMKVFPGKHEEYEKRHNEIWPEMITELRKHGASNYSIFLRKETNELIGYVEIESEKKWNKMSETAINKKWWDAMADIMETNSDNSPKTIELKEVFHME